MATDLQKTYTIKVNFDRNSGGDVLATDLQIENMRALIIKMINNVTTMSEGDYEASWHSDNATGVVES